MFSDEQAARIVVLPDSTWSARRAVIDDIESRGYPVVDIATAMESKVVCAALIGVDMSPPVVIIAHGDACHLLPAVALSLRTQHRDTAGYVLVDPDAPPSTDVWPESPVTVVSTTEQAGTSLRGWPVLSAQQDIAATVGAAATSALEA